MLAHHYCAILCQCHSSENRAHQMYFRCCSYADDVPAACQVYYNDIQPIIFFDIFRYIMPVKKLVTLLVIAGSQ